MVYIILGQPIPLARARILRSGYSYTPKRSAEYKKNIQQQLKIQCQFQPLEGPLSVNMDFYFELAPSLSKKQKAERLGRYRHTQKIDLSNCVKAIEDAANGILWRDDCQISHLIASKQYTEFIHDLQGPRVEITMEVIS